MSLWWTVELINFHEEFVMAHEMAVEGGALIFRIDGAISRAYGPSVWRTVVRSHKS